MPDTRRHRGPHPADVDLFRPATWPILREAVSDLSWLLTRDYPETAALKLVGDRFHLTERQRRAVMRCSCSRQQRLRREARRVDLGQLSGSGETLQLDGFNVLTSVEAALAGGVILLGVDGCYRDMASMHGNYRKVSETRPALELIGRVLEQADVAACHWYLDRPVSNSGRLQKAIEETAAKHAWNWSAELVEDPDRTLIDSDWPIASADSAVIDRCRRWVNLVREVIDRQIPDATIVRLSDGS